MTKSAKKTDTAVNAARDGQVTTVVVSSELEPEPELELELEPEIEPEPEIESCCHSNEGGPENATVEPAGKVSIVAGVNVTVPGCGSAPRRIRLVPVLTPTTVFVSEVPPSSSERYNTSPTLMPEMSSTLTVVAPALMAVVVVEGMPAPAQHRTPLAWYESTEHCSFVFHTCRRFFQVWSRACRRHFHTLSKSTRVQSRNCNQYLWWHRVRFRRMCKAARPPCNKGLTILQTSCPCSTSAHRYHRNVHQSQCLFLHRQRCCLGSHSRHRAIRGPSTMQLGPYKSCFRLR